ncbi:MAG: hypothetical protein HRT35_09390 [Algicola sp.]|nr:hypothetical protein [Algicola sp.]
MKTLNMKKIAMTLGIAIGIFYIPASFAGCLGLTCEPKITCVLGDVESYNNGHPTECDPKDNGCNDGGIYYRQLTLAQCYAQGGVPKDGILM